MEDIYELTLENHCGHYTKYRTKSKSKTISNTPIAQLCTILATDLICQISSSLDQIYFESGKHWFEYLFDSTICEIQLEVNFKLLIYTNLTS